MDEYTSHTDELFHVTVSQFIEPFNNNDKQ